MRTTGGVVFLIVACSTCCFLGFARPAAAVEAGSLRGELIGPDGSPLPSVPVMLQNDITGFSATSVTGSDGSFKFFNVPFNPYVLSVIIQGFQPLHHSVQIRSVVQETITLQLELPSFNQSITVSGERSPVQLETDTSTSHIDIDKSWIRRAPATVASRGMEQLVTSTPGFAKDENGRFHFQGAHSQSEYVIDGQTISDQTGATFSNSIDPGIAQSLEVIYGNIPAEYGEKTGAVINLTTRSGLGSGASHGEVSAGASRFATYEAGGDLGFGSDAFGLFVTVDGSTSDRFLDPVNFDNLHNSGDTERGFIRLDWSPGASESFRLTSLVGRTARQVPNTYTQQLAGQNQRVRTSDANLNLGWQRVANAATVVDALAFGRVSDYDLEPSLEDTPACAYSRRHLNNFGVTSSVSWAAGVHDLKVGGTFKRFPIGERFAFGLTDPSLNDPTAPDYNPNLAPYDLTRGGAMFDFSASRTGTYWAAYAQDTVRVGPLTANVGLRFDHNNLPLVESDLEPRVGVAYYVASTRTVLRGSFNRVFYTPEYENILFSSSPEAAALAPPPIQESRALGGGLLLVRSERQDAYTVGAQQALGSRLRLDIDFWERYSRYAGDQDQFLNTGIVFPLAFSRGRLHGWDLRLDLAATSGLHGFLSLGHTRAIYVAPPVGGLFLDAEAIDSLTGGPFLIDHDQDLQLQSGVTYNLGTTGLWVGANVRYDSGLVTDADPVSLVNDPDNAFAIPYIRVHSGSWNDPNRVASRTIWDFSVGFDPTRSKVPIAVQVDLLNAFDVRGVYNILSVFGGTHVVPPRTVAARIRWLF